MKGVEQIEGDIVKQLKSLKNDPERREVLKILKIDKKAISNLEKARKLVEKEYEKINVLYPHLQKITGAALRQELIAIHNILKNAHGQLDMAIRELK